MARLRPTQLATGVDRRFGPGRRRSLCSRLFSDTVSRKGDASVLVPLGCGDKTPQTGRLVVNGNLSVTVLEAGGPRSSGRQAQCLVRAHFPGHGPLPPLEGPAVFSRPSGE